MSARAWLGSVALLMLALPTQAGGNHGDWCACGMHSSTPIPFEIDHSDTTSQDAAVTSFSRWDAYSDVFSWSVGDNFAGGNGKNEIVWFDVDTTLSVYGIAISTSVFGVTYINPNSAFGSPPFNECPAPGGTTCGFFSETDVIMNADFFRGWTIADPNYTDTGPANYYATAIHELGHALGLHHNFDSLTTMNYYEDFAAIYLGRSDSRAAREYYPSQARTTTDIATYPFRYDGFQYGGSTVASASPAAVGTGDSLTIHDFTIENIGSETPSDVRVRIYLSTNNFISTGDYEIGSVAFSTLATWWDTTGFTFTIPQTVPSGVYYVGAIAFHDLTTEDAIAYNNSWVLDDARQVTVTAICADDAYEAAGSGGSDDTCYGASISEGSTQTHSHCDEDWVRFPAYAGETYEIFTSNLTGTTDTTLTLYENCTNFLMFDDDGAGGLASRIEWTAESDAFFDVAILEFGDAYDAGEGYDVTVNCIANCTGGDLNEPNDGFASATPIQCPSHQSVGTIIYPLNDVDYFALTGPAGWNLSIDIDADEIGSSLDPALGTFGSDFVQRLVSDDDPAPGEGNTLDSYLLETMPADGQLYIAVSSFADFDFDGTDGFYTGPYTLDVNCLCTADAQCDDGNPCTDDVCMADGSCSNTDNTAPCDDANACTVGDSCGGGECQPGTTPLVCNDGNLCTDDACDPGVGCVASNNTAPCDDANACTLGDSCGGGECQPGTTPLVCNDGNLCTDDACDPGVGCVASNNTAPCDDANACTLGDSCGGGECQPGTTPLVCNDGNLCTDDACDPGVGCVVSNNTASCDDGNACTLGDTCGSGECQAGTTPLVCNDGNLCTDDACDPGVGCVVSNNTASCDDGNACTLGDTCGGGECQAGTTPLVCNDGNLCTDDACDPGVGCVASNNTAPCDDADACTLGDSCGGGACQPGTTPLVCNDGNLCTDDACDPGVGCVASNNTAPCDDGSPCTDADVCNAGTCSGIPVLPPGEVSQVAFGEDKETLSWSATPDATNYDVLRGETGSDFDGGAICIGSDVEVTQIVDPDVPSVGSVRYYLTRAGNECPETSGTLGYGSNGEERIGRSCEVADTSFARLTQGGSGTR
jgi:hypothetical protein